MLYINNYVTRHQWTSRLSAALVFTAWCTLIVTPSHPSPVRDIAQSGAEKYKDRANVTCVPNN